MADADEDAIHHPASHDSGGHIDHDLSDETQDFRFLNNLSIVGDASHTTLPRRGEKDFEPNPTLFQSDALAASRQAMHNALSFPRLHHPRNKVVGYYAPDGFAPPQDSLKPVGMASIQEESQKKIEESKAQKPTGPSSTISPDACVYVPNPKGQHFRTVGQGDRWNRVWLLPEEALYLLERGSLDIRWPSEDSSEDNNEDLSIPMSLQAAYACLIGRGGLTLERFSVYSGLKRGGYALLRAPSWNESTEEADREPLADLRSGSGGAVDLMGFLGRLCRSIYNVTSSASTATGPVVGLGIHRSYNDIYRRLSLITAEDPAVEKPAPNPPRPPFRVAYHIYKPSTPFRKSVPPPPDFRIAVVNAREQTTLPTMSQMSALLESTPFDPPRGEKMDKMLYMRLRHGYRNVVLAVVDQGVVSFLRIADMGFSREKIYEDKGVLRGGKRGGFSQRGGRGRGRGR
ncbi:tRNA-splicing endonuclease subunit sen54 [Paecilomyces lecythidis]|uniref:tRNA-splicing endonuclease subunit sen54 n=1 Tax=Paecilomyces lecythidis TaxID=3004212 RepID=A0ABR3XIK8_9EURO